MHDAFGADLPLLGQAEGDPEFPGVLERGGRGLGDALGVDGGRGSLEAAVDRLVVVVHDDLGQERFEFRQREARLVRRPVLAAVLRVGTCRAGDAVDAARVQRTEEPLADRLPLRLPDRGVGEGDAEQGAGGAEALAVELLPVVDDERLHDAGARPGVLDPESGGAQADLREDRTAQRDCRLREAWGLEREEEADDATREHVYQHGERRPPNEQRALAVVHYDHVHDGVVHDHPLARPVCPRSPFRAGELPVRGALAFACLRQLVWIDQRPRPAVDACA